MRTVGRVGGVPLASIRNEWIGRRFCSCEIRTVHDVCDDPKLGICVSKDCLVLIDFIQDLDLNSFQTAGNLCLTSVLWTSGASLYELLDGHDFDEGRS